MLHSSANSHSAETSVSMQRLIQIKQESLVRSSGNLAASPKKSILRGLSRNISSQLYEEFLLFEIEDSGIGMTKEMMESLFSPFRQAQRLAGGTGLGLYSLSKRIEALEGKYGVKGRLDGTQGSVFWFTIPYRPDFAIAEHMHSEKKTDNIFHASRSNRSNRNDVNIPLERKSKDDMEMLPTKAVEVKNLLSLNILLVEDSPTIAKMTKVMLERLGHQVTVAENGHIGLNLMVKSLNCLLGETTLPSGEGTDHSQRFDLVLMDFQMPVMDGLEATRRYREYEKEKGPSFHQLIMGLSATFDPEIVNEAMNMGLDDYLMKPISKDVFTSKISRFFKL